MIVVFKTALLHMHPYSMISSIERIKTLVKQKKASPRPGSSSRGTDGVGHDASRPSQQRVQRQPKQLGGFLYVSRERDTYLDGSPALWLRRNREQQQQRSEHLEVRHPKPPGWV